MRKRIALIIIGCSLLCFVVLREFGVIDANLYGSTLSTSQTATISQTSRGDEKHFSCRLTIKNKNQTLDSYLRFYNDLPPIEIEATLEKPVYSGNCVLPLTKNFRMTYVCEFTTAKSSSEHTVQGKIQGEVNARIHGLCSCRKARALTFEEAKKHVASYFQSQLNL